MKKHSSVTAYLIDRLQAISSFYASRCEYAKANYTANSVKELRSGLIGGKNFGKLHVSTYQEAKILGLDWAEEWIPFSLKRSVKESSTTNYKGSANPCVEIDYPEPVKEVPVLSTLLMLG